MKRIITTIGFATLAFALAACNTTPNQNNNVVVQNTPSGIDGQWVDSNGIVSSFRGGIFETRAADTREKISEGNYKMRNSQLVEIEVRSIVRGTVSRVDCTLANNAMQLFCTSGTGAQFSLARKV